MYMILLYTFKLLAEIGVYYLLWSIVIPSISSFVEYLAHASKTLFL